MTTDTQSNDNDTGESYDGLSPSEIESLTEKDDDAEALDELLGEEDGADGQDSEEAEEAEETDDDADPEASDANGEDEPVSNERQEPVHQGDILKSFDDRTVQLGERFNNGDIELPEYMREVMKIAEDRALYRMQMQMAVESDNRSWEEANEAFFQSNPDYSAARNPKRFEVLQAMVDSVYKDPDFAPTSYLGLLNEAKRRFDEAAGIDTAEKPTEKPAKPRLVSDRASLPPTIKDAPAEAAPPNGGGEFSVLDGLSGMELEAAVSRMSPEQQARWAEAG